MMMPLVFLRLSYLDNPEPRCLAPPPESDETAAGLRGAEDLEEIPPQSRALHAYDDDDGCALLTAKQYPNSSRNNRKEPVSTEDSYARTERLTEEYQREKKSRGNDVSGRYSNSEREQARYFPDPLVDGRRSERQEHLPRYHSAGSIDSVGGHCYASHGENGSEGMRFCPRPRNRSSRSGERDGYFCDNQPSRRQDDYREDRPHKRRVGNPAYHFERNTLSRLCY
jgi:hypothetical protein